MPVDPWLSDVELAPRKLLIEEGQSAPRVVLLQRFRSTIRIDRSHLKSVAVLLLLALAASVWLFWHSRVRETRLAAPRPTISESANTDQLVTDQPMVPIVVDVGGHVRHPGVYSLPAGSRAIDAITAAGGALPGTDMTTVNQAERLEDGEQLVLGMTANSTAGGSPTRTAKVNLNSASVQELDALPGIGPVLATRIVAWRKVNGRFKSVEDLRRVSGVGDAKFADLRPLVRI